MAGAARPNVDGLNEEGSIKFLSCRIETGTNIALLNNLFNGITTREGAYGAVLFNTGSFIEFELESAVNIWAFTNYYRDSGGTNNNAIQLSKWDGAKYVDTVSSVTKNNSTWYKLFDDLEAGRYMMKTITRYAGFDEFYVEVRTMNRSFILSNKEYHVYNIGTPPTSAGNAIPVMTSNTSPSGIASASSVYNSSFYDAWKAFDKSETYGWITANGTLTGWLEYEFPASIKIVTYSIKSTGTSLNISLSNHARDWTFEGTNDGGASWTLLDTQANISFSRESEQKDFKIANPSRYKKYRINIKANNGGSGYSGFGELILETELSPGTLPSWRTMSVASPILSQFQEEGMNNLAVLNRNIKIVPGAPSRMNKIESGTGRLFKDAVDLNKYLDLRELVVKGEQ